jgi:hypothetical protein
MNDNIKFRLNATLLNYYTNEMNHLFEHRLEMNNISFIYIRNVY